MRSLKDMMEDVYREKPNVLRVVKTKDGSTRRLKRAMSPAQYANKLMQEKLKEQQVTGDPDE